MNTVPVKIEFDKTDDGVRVTVDPFFAVINAGDEIEWEVESDYSDTYVSIENKAGYDWPFDTSPPKDMKKGDKKKTGKTKTGAKKKNRYIIQVRLMDGKTPIDFPIDPDIIIIGGAFES